MMKRLLILMILALATGARAQSVFSQESILDFYGQPAAPANPPTNYGRVYYDTATSQLKCLNSDGTNCLSSAGSGTVTSVSGTTNQINVATGTSTPVISLSSTLVLPGTLTGNSTTLFSTTTAATQFLSLKNTTAAVVGTSQGSPILALCGRAFHGATDVEDCLTLGELPGNGNDAAITYTLGHTGSSTGVVTLNLPGSLGFQSATVLQWNGDAGVSRGSSGNINIGSGTAGSSNGTINLAKIAFTAAGSHINTQGASTDVAGTIAISSATSASHSFSTNYTNAPTCVITPITDPTSVGVWWVSTSTSAVTANIKSSGSITFNYVCFAATS